MARHGNRNGRGQGGSGGHNHGGGNRGGGHRNDSGGGGRNEGGGGGRNGSGGGRGGDRNGGRGRGHNGAGVNKNQRYNNNSNGSFTCEFHGQNSTHNTRDCKTKQNTQNKDRNEQRSRKGKDDNGDRNGRRTCCIRCGFTNHSVQTCTAKILPAEEWCECGCEYHSSSKQCFWNCDEEERLTYIANATSKICQWCKGDGDGAHSFDDCPLPTKFRRDLRKRIEDTYDSLLWCWHCSSEDHKTRGCTKQNAQLGKDKWNGKITEIILDWKAVDIPTSNDRYDFEDEWMENNFYGPLGNKAPVAHDPRFAWCLFCEEFGHTGPQPVCDRSEYERRKPTGVSDKGVDRPYVPRNLAWTNGVKEAPAFSGGPATSRHRTFKSECMTEGCRQLLTFDRELMPFGQSTMCPRCRTSNPHPASSHRKSSSSKLLALAAAMSVFANPMQQFKNLLGIPTTPSAFQELQPDSPQDSLRRPSSYITRNIYPSLPPQQVLYADTGEKPKGYRGQGPFMHQPDYYNGKSNIQSHFPATKIRVNFEDQQIAENDELPINLAGRLGHVLMCQKCGVMGNVYDSEGDIVMCATAPANTLCYGPGYGKWTPYKRNQTSWDTVCNCLTHIMGEQPEPRWIAV